MTPEQQTLARDLIRGRIEELGISQGQLARELGVTAPRVSDVLSGRRSLTLGFASRVARELWGREDRGNADIDGDVWLSLFGEELPDRMRG